MPADRFVGVTLARVLRPRGRRGEVAAEVLTDFPERLTRLREAHLWDGTSERRVTVRSCWLHKGQAIFHFEGCQEIADAERLRGLEVQVPLAERVALPAGCYYITDLIGCEVYDIRSCSGGLEAGTSDRPSQPLGSVRDVQFTGEEVPGAPLLVVDSPQGELLIPFAEEICTRVDLAARRIEIASPEGLLNLNE